VQSLVNKAARRFVQNLQASRIKPGGLSRSCG
jgi:hypothetical protein